MKKFWNMMAMALLLGSSAMVVSCDKDDDRDDDRDGGASRIAGVYTGGLSGKVMTVDVSFDDVYDVQIIDEKDADNDEVTVVLPECSFSNAAMPALMTIPAVSVTDVDVERSKSDSNTYLLEEDSFEVAVGGVVYKGSVSGRINGTKAVLNYTLTPGNMPMPINFTFTGELK